MLLTAIKSVPGRCFQHVNFEMMFIHLNYVFFAQRNSVRSNNSTQNCCYFLPQFYNIPLLFSPHLLLHSTFLFIPFLLDDSVKIWLLLLPTIVETSVMNSLSFAHNKFFRMKNFFCPDPKEDAAPFTFNQRVGRKLFPWLFYEDFSSQEGGIVKNSSPSFFIN